MPPLHSPKLLSIFLVKILFRHENSKLAEEVAKAGAVEHLANCIQDPEPSLKKVAAIAICEIAKHNVELAAKVADHPGALKAIAINIKDRDLELRTNVCTCLANIAKHSEEIATKVANAELFPWIIEQGLKEDKPSLQKQAMQCIKEIVGQGAELAKYVVSMNSVGPIVDYLNKTKGSGRLPAIMTLGFMSGFSKDMAKIVIQHNGHTAMVTALKEATQPHIKSAAAWSLGQLAKNSAEFAVELENAKVLPALLEAYNSAGSNADLNTKARRALRNAIEQAQELHVLTPLLKIAPEKIMKRVVRKLSDILKAKPGLKLTFANDGHLTELQAIQAVPESKLGAAIAEINKMFPEDVVHYFTKGYMETLIKQEEDFVNHA